MPRLVLVGLFALGALVVTEPSHAAFDTPTPHTRESGPTKVESPRALKLNPSPSLSPHQVVQVQLNALGSNPKWGDDKGIALAFRFASPGNRQVTGPFPRFARMVQGGSYGSLVGHRKALIGPLQVQGKAGRSVMFPVIVRDQVGQNHGFVWVLSRQSKGRFRNCWMTDAVFPADLDAVNNTFPSRRRI